MKILVCGGAGYIGSHTVYALLDSGHEVVVLDNLENGHIKAVHKDAQLAVCDLRNMDAVEQFFSEHKGIDAVIDFAAYSLVGESVSKPLEYYGNNMGGTLNLLKGMVTAGIGHLVFSSTAATYGEPDTVPITEDAPTHPGNPYGETKLAVEKMLKWASEAYGIKYGALRYFNVAGAHTSGKIGEDHCPETHLIPNILKVALGQSDIFTLFGDDYDTPDGTCVRDYIHVSDLAAAHILALQKIMDTGENKTYNLGNGKGFSNMEILKTAEAVTGKTIPCKIGPRRAGDPAVLVASSRKIMEETGWSPEAASLETIIATAWAWHSCHPKGFNAKN